MGENDADVFQVRRPLGLAILGTILFAACASVFLSGMLFTGTAALIPGTHASTFGGNPLACAVASTVLDELVDGGILDHAKSMGERLGEGLESIAAEAGPKKVLETRGRGLLRGLALADSPAAVIDGCRERGVLVISAGGNVLRLAPPLIISAEEIDHGLEVLREVLLATDG